MVSKVAKREQKPEVSIIIPTFNAANKIAHCLRSIYNQTYTPINVVVIDNFSSDSTVSIAKTFGAKIAQEKSTPGAARNIGVTLSKGKYVFFVDSDQILSRRLVEECVVKCEKDNAKMVRVQELFIGDGFWGSCSAEWKNYYIKIERKYGKRRDILSGEPRFFEREQLIQAGMFNASLLWGEDYDMYQRLKQGNVKEVCSETKLYHFEPGSIRGIMAKNLRYGESMSTFRRYSDKQVFSRVAKHSILAWGETISDLADRPDIALGCTLLLGMKGLAMTAGLLANFM